MREGALLRVVAVAIFLFAVKNFLWAGDLVVTPGFAGFIDTNGTVVIQGPFLEMKGFSEGLAAVLSHDAQWGYVDHSGRMVIKPGFDEARKHRNGLAAVRVRVSGEMAWGFIDTRGEWAIPPGYASVQDFSSNVCVVGIASSGEVVAAESPRLLDLDERGVVSRPSKNKVEKVRYGLIDRTGRYLVQPTYDAMGNMHEDRISVCLAGKWGWIKGDGGEFIPPRYEWCGEFCSGVAWYEENGKCGAIDVAGKVVVPPRFDMTGPFAEGISSVQVGGRWGAVDRKGTWVIQPKYEYLGPFVEGAAQAWLDGKKGIIRRDESFLVPAEYGIVYDFSEGFCVLRKKGRDPWTYIVDKSGKMRMRLSDGTVWDDGFTEGLLPVRHTTDVIPAGGSVELIPSK